MNESWIWASIWDQCKGNDERSFAVLKLRNKNAMGLSANK